MVPAAPFLPAAKHAASAHSARLEVMAFVEGNFERKGFKGFGSGSESFTHGSLMRQVWNRF